MVCKPYLCIFIILALFHILTIHPFYSPTQALTALLSDDSKFGFIVIDGSGALFGTLQGNTREVLHKFTVDLPKKHGTEPECSEKKYSLDIPKLMAVIFKKYIYYSLSICVFQVNL